MQMSSNGTCYTVQLYLAYCYHVRTQAALLWREHCSEPYMKDMRIVVAALSRFTCHQG